MDNQELNNNVVNTTWGAEQTEVRNWSWGAFLSSWVWAIYYRCWWGLLSLIPFALFSWIVPIILGIKGDKIALNSGRVSDLNTLKKINKNG